MAGLFSGEARRPEFSGAYDLYLRRRRRGVEPLTRAQFAKAVRAYCRLLAEELETTGMAELPCGLGCLAAGVVRRRPRWDPKARKWRTADPVDWEETRRTGTLTRKAGDGRAFAITYVPAVGGHRGDVNRMCLGFQANRGLFRRMKDKYDGGELGFKPRYIGQ